MLNSKCLSIEFKNETKLIDKIDSDDIDFINQLYNLGIYPGNQVYVCDFISKKILKVIVDNIQYALRISDAKKIILK